MVVTKIIKIDEKNLDLVKLGEAAEVIKAGGLVVFPTETVYGLGADALDAGAVSKIYAVKGRPPDNPLIVHVPDARGIYEYAEVPAAAEQIINKFMPGPLTLVLRKLDNRLDASCMLDTVAIRVPGSRTARKLIELAGVPIAAPSANLSGKPSPTSAEHIIKDLSGRAEIIICGENCEIGLESTVISFNSDGSLNILRPGFITREDLSGFKVREDSGPCLSAPAAPGMKYKHYSPDAPLYILSGGEQDIIDFVKSAACGGRGVGVLCYDEMLAQLKDCANIHAVSVGARHSIEKQARNLFGALNKFNRLGVDMIYAVEPDKVKVGVAVHDRLFKAAGGKIIKL